jgi:hypothetical protein
MGLFSAIRKMFTSPYCLRPEEWLRAIPLLQEELAVCWPIHLDLEKLRHCRNIFDALEALLLVKVELENEAQISREMGEEGLPYPVRITKQQFALICDLLYFRGSSPLSNGELELYPIDSER